MHHLRIVLLGAPGAGKGTQAAFICEKYHLPKVSTGDMLRAEILADTLLGRTVKQLMANGKLVSDELIIDLLKNRIGQPDCMQGFLLDGFPRNVSQAMALVQAGISIDQVVYIHVPDEDIISRLSGRRTHLSSGRTYHIRFNPPKVADKDDITGEALVQREDDTESAVRTRLMVYHQETEPVIEWYKNTLTTNQFHTIEGTGAVKLIQDRILKVLEI